MKRMAASWRGAGSIVIAGVLLFSVQGVAGQVRCPVCQEVFSDSVAICPNDGTDLKIDGERLEETESVDPDSSSGESEDVSGERDTAQSTDKGRRRGLGGLRKSAAEIESEKEAAARTDRALRLGDERTRGVPEEGRRLRQDDREAFLLADARLRRRYQTDRIAFDRLRATQDVERARLQRQWELRRQRRLETQAAPVVSLGSRLSFMGESAHPGPVTGAEIDLHFLFGRFRGGVSSFAGVRALEHRSDFLLTGAVVAGLQMPARYSPFLQGRLGMGALFSERFGERLTYLVPIIGVETGLDMRFFEKWLLEVAMGYLRYSVNGASWHSATIKVAVGF